MNRMNERQQEGLLRALDDVTQERIRQHARFGEQDLPRGADAVLRAILRGQLETCRKQIAALRGAEPWDLVLLEEACEALLEDEPARLRAELVQVAAVAVQWIEAIDRAGPASPPSVPRHLAPQPRPRLPTEDRPVVAQALAEFARRMLPREGHLDRLIEDIHARSEQGRQSYGCYLQPDCGRDLTVDQYQEQLDAAMYAAARMLAGADVAEELQRQLLLALLTCGEIELARARGQA